MYFIFPGQLGLKISVFSFQSTYADIHHTFLLSLELIDRLIDGTILTKSERYNDYV